MRLITDWLYAPPPPLYCNPTQLHTEAMFANSVYNEQRDNWQTICESHINLSNNLIIYLKRNRVLWCSRTFNSALVWLSQTHTYTFAHSLSFSHGYKYKHSCAQRSVHSKSNRSHIASNWIFPMDMTKYSQLMRELI